MYLNFGLFSFQILYFYILSFVGYDISIDSKKCETANLLLVFTKAAYK